MKGQTKAVIPALIGIVPLLLAGITGYVNSSGEQQATDIAETRIVSRDMHQRGQLADELRADAEAAAARVSDHVAADLAIELVQGPKRLAAANARERG